MKRPLKHFPLILTLLLTTVVAISCGKDKSPLKFSANENEDVSPIKIDPAKTDPAWASMKRNLFDASCTKCHNPDTAKRKKRLDLTQKEVVLENYEDIVYRMTDAFDTGVDYMPPKGDPVKPAIVNALKIWKEREQTEHPQN
jgi:cytochrome c5